MGRIIKSEVILCGLVSVLHCLVFRVQLIFHIEVVGLNMESGTN